MHKDNYANDGKPVTETAFLHSIESAATEMDELRSQLASATDDVKARKLTLKRHEDRHFDVVSKHARKIRIYLLNDGRLTSEGPDAPERKKGEMPTKDGSKALSGPYKTKGAAEGDVTPGAEIVIQHGDKKWWIHPTPKESGQRKKNPSRAAADKKKAAKKTKAKKL